MSDTDDRVAENSEDVGDQHEPDCDCIYCQLDHMQERADRRREEEIDDNYEPPEPDINADGPAERDHRMDEARRSK